jgi:hypothetical protein
LVAAISIHHNKLPYVIDDGLTNNPVAIWGPGSTFSVVEIGAQSLGCTPLDWHQP